MTGYPRKKLRVRPAFMFVLMSACSAQSLADEDELPGMELLEFLAEWETPDGQWVDPVELDAPATASDDDTDPEVPNE